MYLYFLILFIDLILLYYKIEWFGFHDILDWEFNLNNIGFFLFNLAASLIISFIIFLCFLPFILKIELKILKKKKLKKTSEDSNSLNK